VSVLTSPEVVNAVFSPPWLISHLNHVLSISILRSETLGQCVPPF